jgi:hypothetical protein
MIAVESRHLEGAVIVPTRLDLLSYLPQRVAGVEIGVDGGDFSAELLRTTEPTLLHLVDPWATRRYGDEKFEAVTHRFRAEIDAGRVKLHRTVSTIALAEVEDSSLGWAYIDSDHSYGTTLAELELLHRKVAGDGVIAGHDFVTGNWMVGVRYGVVEAVNRFCVERDWRFVALTHEPDRHLSFALARLDA